MRIEDPDWKAIFGTDTDRIEKPVKLKPGPVPRHQFEAALILERPELFGFGWSPDQENATSVPERLPEQIKRNRLFD